MFNGNATYRSCRGGVGLTLDLDAVGLQIESYLPTCVCKAAPQWCGLGCRSLNSQWFEKSCGKAAFTASKEAEETAG